MLINKGRLLPWRMVKPDFFVRDHLGSVRAVVSGDGRVLETNSYYPYGMKIDALSSTNYTSSDVPNRYKYNGKEEFSDLEWLGYGARFYDAAVSRWWSRDPKAEKYYAMTPYSYVAGNVVNAVDLWGMDLWKPVVENGQVFYIAEKGDNLETFAEQYNLDIDKAKEIIGNTKIEEGTKISGERVAEVTGSPILKLNLKSKLATEQRIFDQLIFAIDYTNSQGKIGFFTNEYYTNFMYTPITKFENYEANMDGMYVQYSFPLKQTFYTGKEKFKDYPVFIENQPFKAEHVNVYWNNKTVEAVNLFFHVFYKIEGNLRMQGYYLVIRSYYYNIDRLWDRFFK